LQRFYKFFRTDEYDNLSLDELERNGFDGVILPNDHGGFEGFVFNSNQIKSAVSNNGEFNPNSDNINE